MATPNPRRRGKGENKHSLRRLAAADKALDAVKMKRDGATYKTIADTLGFSSTASAFKAVSLGLKIAFIEPVEELVKIELARLDAMVEVLWPDLEDPDKRIATVLALLKISERRSRYMGMDAPKKIEASGPGGKPIELTAVPFRPEEMSDDELRRIALGSG